MNYKLENKTLSGVTTRTKQLPTSKRWTPHAYQKKAVKWMLERGAAGLFLDPGLGKTSITLAALSVMLDQKVVKGALVIAPLRPVYATWPAEIEKWLDFATVKHSILHGSKKSAALKTQAHIYLINPEGLRWLFRELGANPDRWPFDTLIVDESSKFKNTRTQRFRELRDMLPKFRRRYILTGTPTPNGLMDLFGQIYLLDLGNSLGRYITHYRTTYFNPGGFGGYDFFLKPGADQKIYEKIAPLVLRMDEKDYLELPPLIETNRVVELPKEARKVYNDLERAFVHEFVDGKITAVNAAAATIKLRQITSGGAYTAEGGTAHIHDEKTEELLDLLEELEGQPALVAYEFKHDLARLLPALKKAGFGDVPHLGGGVSPKESLAIVNRWNKGELPVLLGHPQSIAHGLNLQEKGRAVIWHSLTWDLELYDQFIRRVYRQGQTQRVFLYHIVAKDTIDEDMMSALKRKTRGQRALLDALRDRYL